MSFCIREQVVRHGFARIIDCFSSELQGEKLPIFSTFGLQGNPKVLGFQEPWVCF